MPKLTTKTVKVFITSDKKEHTDKASATAHQKKLNRRLTVAPLVEKMYEKSKPMTNEELDAATLFGEWLLDQGMLVVPKRKAKAKPTNTAQGGAQ